MGALYEAFRAAAHDDDVWALVITGNGDAFCSGLDLDQSSDDADGNATVDEEPHDDRDEPDHFSLLIRVNCEKPILAGVNGARWGSASRWP